jgi:hypothetical protein
MTESSFKSSRKQEKSVAKRLGGQLTVGSGSRWFNKGDVRTECYLVECKTTGKLSYTIKSSELRKIETEALLEGRNPVLVFDLDGRRYAILPFDDFMEFTERD